MKNHEQLLEDITKSEINSMISNKLNSSENKKIIKKICGEVLSDLYKTLWQRKSFWSNDVTK